MRGLSLIACLALLPAVATAQPTIPDAALGNEVLANVGVTFDIGGFNLPDGFAQAVGDLDRDEIINRIDSIADVAVPDMVVVFVRDWVGASRMTFAMGLSDLSTETAALAGSGQIVGASSMPVSSDHVIPFIMLIETPDVSVDCYAYLIVNTIYTGDAPQDETLLRCVSPQ